MNEPATVLRAAGIDTAQLDRMIAKAQEEIARLRSLKSDLIRETLRSRETKENSNGI